MIWIPITETARRDLRKLKHKHLHSGNYRKQQRRISKLVFFVLGFLMVVSYLCYQDGALKGEALFNLIICFVSVIVIFIPVGVLIYRINQEIGYNEDGVILFKNQGKLLPWRELGLYEKWVKRVTFYSRNGDKLFTIYETDEGYKDFWRFYQMHV